jgi:hypothetical protein
MTIKFFEGDISALNNEYIYNKGVILLKEMLDRDLDNYLKENALYIGHNWNSGYTYTYLEGMPHINLTLNYNNELVTIYTSWLDGLEFEKIIEEETLEELEEMQSKLYELDEKRDAGGISENDFIDEIEKLGWESI